MIKKTHIRRAGKAWNICLPVEAAEYAKRVQADEFGRGNRVTIQDVFLHFVRQADISAAPEFATAPNKNGHIQYKVWPTDEARQVCQNYSERHGVGITCACVNLINQCAL